MLPLRPHDPFDQRPRSSGAIWRSTADEDDEESQQDEFASKWSQPPGRPRSALPALSTRELESFTSIAPPDGATLSPVSPANTSVKIQESLKERQVDPVGLTLLHEPESNPIAELVFIHSVGGGSRRSWSYGDSTENFWPLEWLSKEPIVSAARISTFGYNSHLSSNDAERVFDISNTAKDLLTRLRFGADRESRSLNVGHAPLIFIAHSIGGLIAKKAYILCQSETNTAYAEIARAVTAFVFFATPHRGIHVSNVVNDILSVCVPGWLPGNRGKVIRRQLPALQDINEHFRDLAAYVTTVSFYELQDTPLVASSESLILRPDLATLDHSHEITIPLDANHLTITKYKSPRDANYTNVRGVLQKLVQKFKPHRRQAAQEDTREQAEKVKELLGRTEAPEDDLSTFSEKRLPGSCEWVLHRAVMKSFIQSAAAYPQILWCSGGPGSGKSVTATFLIEELMSMSKPTAYYYFRSGDQVKNNLSQFLLSVAFQLSSSVPEYRRKLYALAEDRFDASKAGHKLLWKKLFGSALLTCRQKVPFYLILDGLDELSTVGELLQKFFIDLADKSVPLRLLLISRTTSEIDISIERLSRRIDVQRMSLDGNSEDLAMYVQDEMQQMMGDDAFKMQTQQEVIAKASGNFLWAHLVVKEILDCQTEVQVENALRQVPKELEPLYRRMDSQLADTFRSRPADKALGHTILMWVTCSKYPLRLADMRNALQPEFRGVLDMRQTIQKLCREFVVVDRKEKLSMMHSSAREFLMSNSDLNYHINAQKVHHTLFCKCVQAISKRKGTHEPVGEQDRTFFVYATSSWPFHLTQSSGHEDQQSLTELMGLFGNECVLEWMYTLAETGSLRILVEASKSLTDFLRKADQADSERSPLTHRLTDKATLQLWAQDLIRVVGKFGAQITRHPRAVYSLIPTFCPKDSIFYKKFGQRSSLSAVVVRGRISSTWDDCFAKFTVTSENLPHRIFTLDRHFAVLMKANGSIHFYYSSTCESARSITHGEVILSMCFNVTGSRMATYGFSKTKIWDIESGRHLFSVENSPSTKALAITFKRNESGEECIFTFSNDRVIRSCSLESMRIEWERFGDTLGREVSNLQHTNAPRAAQFSPDGLYLAVAYRGAHPSVWFLGGPWPEFIAQCDHRARSGRGHMKSHTGFVYAQAFSWNPLTGHLLGTFNDDFVFKWHPRDDDFAISDVRSTNIKCSSDGKLFVTSSGDGTLRIWDFDDFTPMYQLRYPFRIQDLELGRNEARIYDIRDQYCNIWEPNALLRAMEYDSRVGDAQSSHDSTQPSLASEAVQEDFEPITAFSTKSSRACAAVYAIGDDAGLITISNFDGTTLSQIQDSPMSIEKLAWCDNANLLASVDLDREVKVRCYATGLDETEAWPPATTLRTFSDSEGVLQLLFDCHGDSLLVVTASSIKQYQILSKSPPKIGPSIRKARWISHPLKTQYALGVGTDRLGIIAWSNVAEMIPIAYDLNPDQQGSSRPSLLQLNPRRPSQAYPISPSELETEVHKVLVSSDGTLIFVEIFGLTKQTKRRSECLMIKTELIDTDWKRSSVSVTSVPTDITKEIYVSLGFTDTDDPILPGHRRPSGQLSHDLQRSYSRRQFGQHTFVFVDQQFWVCSVNIGVGNYEPTRIRKHFFLPRDWHNAEWLEMATVTSSGDFLCPRNGSIGVVSNGFVEEWVD